MTKKIKDKRMINILFIICWIVYFSSYIGRLNFSSSMAEMISNNVITKIEAGSINMMFFLSYGIGQFINGFLGDKFKPRYMIVVGLSLAAFANLLMPLSVNPMFFMGIWGLNGYANSMIWAPILRIFSENLHIEDTNKACVNIASSMALGTLGSYFLTAMMISFFNWKAAFLLPGILLIVVTIVFWFTMRKMEFYIEKNGEVQDIYIKDDREYKNLPFKQILFGTGLIMFLLPVILHGFLKDGATSWVPTYIFDEFNLSTSFSSIMTMIIPIVNLFGAYAASFVHNRLRSEAKTSSFFFFLSSGILLMLIIIGHVNVILSTFLLALVTSSMMAINIMLINFLPVHFAKYGRVSTVSGFLNASAYLGSAACTYSVGVLLEKTSWNIVFCSWLVISVLGGILCVWGTDPQQF